MPLPSSPGLLVFPWGERDVSVFFFVAIARPRAVGKKHCRCPAKGSEGEGFESRSYRLSQKVKSATLTFSERHTCYYARCNRGPPSAHARAYQVQRNLREKNTANTGKVIHQITGTTCGSPSMPLSWFVVPFTPGNRHIPVSCTTSRILPCTMDYFYWRFSVHLRSAIRWHKDAGGLATERRKRWFTNDGCAIARRGDKKAPQILPTYLPNNLPAYLPAYLSTWEVPLAMDDLSRTRTVVYSSTVVSVYISSGLVLYPHQNAKQR